MKISRSQILTLGICLGVVCLGGCKKREPQRTPLLSPPGQAFPSHVGATAEAEVSASSGPVKITLRLHRAKTRVRKPLWYQIVLENIGAERFRILDDIFSDPRAIRKNTERRRQIFLEIIAPDGHMVDMHPLDDYQETEDSPAGIIYRLRNRGKPPFEEQFERVKMLDQWKKEGLSHEAIEEKLIRYYEDRTPPPQPRPVFWLEPGQTVVTQPWVHRDDWEEAFPQYFPWAHPIGQFAELWDYEFYEPGEYRIRAVYDHSLTKKPARSEGERRADKTIGEINRRHPTKPIPWAPNDVLIQTPPLLFEVLP